MKRILIALVTTLPLLLGDTARATKLELNLLNGTTSSITVAPNALVSYQVVGILDEGRTNQGLAAITFDLEFDGGILSPANSPVFSPMTHFAPPLGLTNPAGFGGTVLGIRLAQVGGMQNTTNNASPPGPIGSVQLGVGHSSVPLISGTLVAPAVEGVYILSATDIVATVIKLGETGVPYWATRRVDDEAATPLTVTVSASAPAGACCMSDGSCAIAGPTDCSLLVGLYQGNSTNCPSVTCAVFTIPTTSEWGVGVLSVFLTIAATIIFARRASSVSRRLS